MSRREAREKAFQALFQIDVGRARPQEAIAYVLEEDKLDEKDVDFMRTVVYGTVQHLQEVDAYIRRHAVDWNLERLGNVDRTLLRLAIYEMLYMEDIPHVVSINEAVELAKIYGSEESSRFINGVLDSIRKALEESEGMN